MRDIEETQPPRPASSLNHLAYIDALRGIAFLGVLLIHSSLQSPAFGAKRWAETGQYGVQLFFLLSAVTLVRSLSIRGRKEAHPIRNYFIRRFFRIAPLFWCGIVFSAALDGLAPRWTAPFGLHVWQFITAATFTHGWSPTSINAIVPGGWSIAVEMTFYLCLPWLFRHAPDFWSALVATFVAIIVGAILTKGTYHFLQHWYPASEQGQVNQFFGFWFPTQLPVFLLGIALCHALQDERLQTFLRTRGHVPVILVSMGCYGFFNLTKAATDEWLPINFVGASALTLLILGLSARPLRLFVNQATCYLGTISFSCYLTHFAALRIVKTALQPDRFLRLPVAGAECYFAATVFGALVLTVLFSTVTYRLIERPGIALGRWLIKRGELQPALAGLSA